MKQLASSLIVFSIVMLSHGRADVAKVPEALQALVDADKVVLYSIDGELREPGKETKSSEKFGGFPVLGKVQLSKEARAEIVAAMAKGLNQDAPAKCFNPRHGLLATKGDKTVAYVICFECNRTTILLNDKQTQIRISAATQPTFDKILKAANIPLAPK